MIGALMLLAGSLIAAPAAAASTPHSPHSVTVASVPAASSESEVPQMAPPGPCPEARYLWRNNRKDLYVWITGSGVRQALNRHGLTSDNYALVYTQIRDSSGNLLGGSTAANASAFGGFSTTYYGVGAATEARFTLTDDSNTITLCSGTAQED